MLKALANSSIIQAFIAKPTPKWMVYLADLVLIAFSCLLTFAFGTHQTYGTSFIYTPLARALFEFITYAVLAYVLGSSKYIIRLSVIEDAYRLVLLIVSASLVLSTVSLGTYFAFGYLYFSIWNIIIVGLMAFALMLIMRLSIKYFYLLVSGATQSKNALSCSARLSTHSSLPRLSRASSKAVSTP